MKVEVHKKYRHGKTYVSGELEGVSFSTRDPSVEVDGIVYPKIDRALLMFTEAGSEPARDGGGSQTCKCGSSQL